MKNFFKSLVKWIILSIVGIIALMWVFSALFPRAYNVIEGKVLGIKEDSVITVVQNKDTIVVAKPKAKPLSNSSEHKIKMEHDSGCYLIHTKINGIPMKLTLDTGASHLTLSSVEYEFLRKQNLLGNHTVEEGACTIANGQTVKCYTTKIDSLTIGDVTIKDVECDIMEQQTAPLLLGMNVLRQFGNFSIDYKNNLLILKD